MSDAKSARPMLVFVLCFLAGLCEGYDMLVAGVTAPKFAPVFHLDPQHLGMVFSASTFGLFVGAIVGGRVADHVGRRILVISSLLLLGVFSIASAAVDDTNLLLLMRLLAGLGLGGALPNILAMTNESSRSQNAGMRVTMLGSAMPFGGGIVAGLTAARPDLDWQAVFWIGGLAPIAVAVVMLFVLPESPAFLQRTPEAPRGNIAVALGGDKRFMASLLLWIGSFFTALALYMMINWLPLLLTGRGFGKADVGKIIMILTLGGAASGFVFGALARLPMRRLLYVFTWAGMAASVLAMAQPGHDLRLAAIAGFGIGFFISGGQFLLYALATEIYPSAVRGTGVGFAVGIGRLGAVAGPLLAGGLLAANSDAGMVMLAVVPLIFLSLAATLGLPGTGRAQPRPAQNT